MAYRSIEKLTGWMVCLALSTAVGMAAEPLKQSSALFTRQMRERALANKQSYPWAGALWTGIVERAKPWMGFSDDELWEMIYAPTIPRSHMVWSSGYCPACRKPVPMYDWEIDALARRWKVRCPHCREQFPKNDFATYYRSGLDEHGLFVPARADHKLLFNTEHPGANDPLRSFGVDDGNGYQAEGKRWYFVAAYAQRGHFTQLIMGGIENLSAAYLLTGEAGYAHKAGILLDRLADVWPDYDFADQGYVYEHKRYGGGMAGYVQYAINSAGDVRSLALAYDQVFEAMRTDGGLLAFLREKAARLRLSNPKSSFADVQRNIEDRILRDAIRRPEKIRTNYPGVEATIAIAKTVLAWPENRDEVLREIDAIVDKSTAVDGLTGEKGLNGYAVIGPEFLTRFLELYGRVDEKLLSQLLARHPKLRETYPFFVDTWVGRQYYPHSGDCGAFATRDLHYAGADLASNPAEMLKLSGLPVSAHSFFWRMARATKDPMYLQLSYLENGNRTDGLPYDLFAEDPLAVQRDVKNAIARSGELKKSGSVNKQAWRIALLRSPRDPDGSVVWLDYDSVPVEGVRGHFHYDAMNVGLYARGLDLLPEFGYPAVQFGDWHTPQAKWHFMTAAHNTVVVDGKNQSGGDAKTTLWADGQVFRAIRASSPAQVRGAQYERTLAMVDLPEKDYYALDVFRVVGGTDHARMLHSTRSRISVEGLNTKPDADYGHGALMRNFQVDAAPKSGWSAVFEADDFQNLLPKGSEVRLRFTDLTSAAQASTAESWTVRTAVSTEQFWIPTVMTRRQSKTAPLASTFVGVLEPYGHAPRVRSIRRLELTTPAGKAYGDANVGIECALEDGRKDVWIAADEENPLGAAPSLKADGELCESASRVCVRGESGFVRWSAQGDVETVALARGAGLKVGQLSVELAPAAEFVELGFERGRAVVLTGKVSDVKRVMVKGKALKVQARSQRSSQP